MRKLFRALYYHICQASSRQFISLFISFYFLAKLLKLCWRTIAFVHFLAKMSDGKDDGGDWWWWRGQWGDGDGATQFALPMPNNSRTEESVPSARLPSSSTCPGPPLVLLLAGLRHISVPFIDSLPLLTADLSSVPLSQPCCHFMPGTTHWSHVLSMHKHTFNSSEH